MELVNELYQLEPKLSPGGLAETCRDANAVAGALCAIHGARICGKSWAVLAPSSGKPGRRSTPNSPHESEIEIPVQVNGKLRGHLRVAVGTSREQLETLALDHDKVKTFIEGKADRQNRRRPRQIDQYRCEISLYCEHKELR